MSYSAVISAARQTSVPDSSLRYSTYTPHRSIVAQKDGRLQDVQMQEREFEASMTSGFSRNTTRADHGCDARKGREEVHSLLLLNVTERFRGQRGMTSADV